MTTITTAAVVRESGGQFSLESVELDDLRVDEVLVRIEACGVCHTDIVAQDMMELPAVFGHEGTGVVEAVGSGVRLVRPGTRVILSYPSCGSCPNCVEGDPYICDMAIPLSFGGARQDQSQTVKLEGDGISSAFFQQSAFASHAISTERNLISISTEGYLPLMLAALPCGVQTGAGTIINTFGASAKHSLAVFGSGAVGLSAIMMARVLGLTPRIAVDIVDERLNLARELGATHSINSHDGDVARRILDIVPRGVDFSFESSADEQALNDAIACLNLGGTCGIVTAPHMGQKYPFSPSEVMMRAANLKGVFQGSSVPRTFLPWLIKLQQQGLFPYEQLITEYDFTDINQAFADAQSGIAIKPVLKMS